VSGQGAPEERAVVGSQEVSARAAGYPSRWEADVVVADGGTVHVRPIKPSDAAALRALHERLSPETVYFRFFTALPHLAPAMLERFVNVDYVNRMALVAELGDELIGVARYDRLPGGSPPEGSAGPDAEVAFTVDDAHQGRGIGTILLEHLAVVARDNGIARFVADTLPNNQRMLRVFHDAGFAEERAYADGVVRVAFPIEPTDASLTAMDDRERQAAARSVERLLRPRSVAVVGAGRHPGGVGHQVLRNLLDGGFVGPVYPVHPTARHVASVRAYPSVLDVPDEVDLAVIAVPAMLVPDVVDQCAAKRVGGLVVISSGFGERSEEGAAVERQLVITARRHGMRLIGPNSLGVINTDPGVRLNATFSPSPPLPGRIGFISQSGGLGVVILDEMASRGLGVSTFVSAGNKADVSSNDLIQYWDRDASTDVVLLYLESFGNPRAFARVGRHLSRQKPIVAVKSGRSQPGRRAASSHTAALATTDSAVDALFLQSGVIRVDTLPELFDVAQVLATQPLPAGRGVAIVANSGGPGVMAADACDSAGLDVPELGPAVQAHLRDLLGADAAIANPVEMAHATTPDVFGRALAAALADPVAAAAVAIFSAPLAPFADEMTGAIVEVARQQSAKPVLACVLGHHVIISRGGHAVPSFAFPESAVMALARVARYAEWRRRPEGRVAQLDDVDRAGARTLVDAILSPGQAPDDTGPAGPGWLDMGRVAQLLGAYRIPLLASRRAATREEAVEQAQQLGYPVAVKVVGPDPSDRPGAGGARFGLTGPAQVAEAFDHVRAAAHGDAGVVVQVMGTPGVDLVVDVSLDPLFGHLVALGTGGLQRFLDGDRELRAVPLSDLDARDLIRSARASPLLVGEGGFPPADIGALEELLLRVGRLVEDLPEVAELSLDPVIASPDGAVAAGAGIRLARWQPKAERRLRRLR
jgi:acetyl coenzyme A synthetase (ADP forming)-like protein